MTENVRIGILILKVIKVHTRFWSHQLSDDLITRISETTIGFSGSDIQALCTEAVLCCLKRSYPSINTSKDLRKIRLNLESLKVTILSIYIFK